MLTRFPPLGSIQTQKIKDSHYIINNTIGNTSLINGMRVTQNSFQSNEKKAHWFYYSDTILSVTVIDTHSVYE